MRRKKPKSGNLRVVSRFLFFSRTLSDGLSPDGRFLSDNSITKWLEGAEIVQDCTYGEWEDLCWGGRAVLEAWERKLEVDRQGHRETNARYQARRLAKIEEKANRALAKKACVYCGMKPFLCGCGWVKANERTL